MFINRKKSKSHSINTKEINKKLEEKLTGNLDKINTSSETDYNPQDDTALLQLGTRREGGSQVVTDKNTKVKPKDGSIDLSKYMTTGFTVDTSKLSEKKGYI